MSGRVARSAISDTVLDVVAHQEAVSGDGTGAVALFLGQVRDHSPDAAGEVVGLEYVAHPDSEQALGTIAADVAGRHPQVALAVSHRIGQLEVGQVAIVVAAGSAHRPQAFAACRELLEAVKEQLPIWKKQTLVDGSHTWVGAS